MIKALRSASVRRSRTTLRRISATPVHALGALLRTAVLALLLFVMLPVEESSLAGFLVTTASDEVAGGVHAIGNTSKQTLRSTTLPLGWPAATPNLRTPREERTWNLVYQASVRHGVEDRALAIYGVLWEESRLREDVRSRTGRYKGIAQFCESTFAANVAEMKHRGLLPSAARFSPLRAEHAIEVMTYMWSRGHELHWSPTERVLRRLDRLFPEDPSFNGDTVEF